MCAFTLLENLKWTGLPTQNSPVRPWVPRHGSREERAGNLFAIAESIVGRFPLGFDAGYLLLFGFLAGPIGGQRIFLAASAEEVLKQLLVQIRVGHNGPPRR